MPQDTPSENEKVGGRGGPTQGEYLFTGALILIIIAVLVFIFWPRVTIGCRLPLVTQVHFRCLKCGHEYAKDRDQLTKAQMFMEGEPYGILDDCPKCGAKDESRQKVKCPECEKYYLPKVFTYPKGCPDVSSNICEHCGIDVNKWYIEDAKKRKSPSRTAPKTETPDFP